jgi:septal ring factor EnvC (AmiA/AmiB activator)
MPLVESAANAVRSFLRPHVEHENTRQEKAALSYAALVAKLANNEQVPPAKATADREAAGKSIDDLVADVALKQRRIKESEEKAQVESDMEAGREVAQKIEEMARAAWEAEEQAQKKIDEYRSQNQKYLSALRSGPTRLADIGSFLFDSGSPELRDALKAAHAKVHEHQQTLLIHARHRQTAADNLDRYQKDVADYTERLRGKSHDRRDLETALDLANQKVAGAKEALAHCDERMANERSELAKSQAEIQRLTAQLLVP